MVTNPFTFAGLTRNQIRGFWAAWGGWALDGMDSFIYALVMVPALRELLPRSGLAASDANIGFYGSILFALFLIGWGFSFAWGPFADRFGRVRTLMLTILCYSLFTFAGAIATNVGQLAILRLIAGIGIGGEWTLGGTFVAEEWPEDRRKMGAGMMQTGYYFGILIAALLNATIGARYGWRAMFAIGGLPALLIIFIRYAVTEPSRWKPAPSAKRSFSMIFSREYRRKTILNSLYLLVSITGLWAGSVYVPTAVTTLAGQAGINQAGTTRVSSFATVYLSIATIAGCLVLPTLAEKFGRRRTLAIYFAIMALSIWLGFGAAFYAGVVALPLFLITLVFLGFGGANFTMYTLWLPEQYPTACRASAFAFCTSAGRFVGAGITFLVGAGVSYFQTIGKPVALTAIVFVIGLLLLPFGVETKGKSLPA